MLMHRLTAAASLLIAIGLYVASIYSGSETGYEFPQAVAISMIALTAVLVAMSFKPSIAAISADEQPVPWRHIWPALAVFLGYLFLAMNVGFFVTSFLAFLALALIYTPGRLDRRNVAIITGVAFAFMTVLYLIFVALLNVQTPRGLLF